MAKGLHPFTRAAATGKRIAVVGAGPAGLACAHRLAMHGHDVVIFERRPKAGGMNEYGIASYKATGGFVQKEVDWLLQIGGIEIRTGMELGRDLSLHQLTADFDAVFFDRGMTAVDAAVQSKLLGAENVTIVYRRGQEKMSASG